MSDYGRFKVHPIADAFPLIGGEEFDAMVADIREHGLMHNIVLAPDGETIVDGRNRYRACMEAMVDPVYETLPSTYDELAIIQLIVSTNLHRRHMTTTDKAVLGVQLEKAYAVEAKKRQAEAGRLVGKANAIGGEKLPVKMPEAVSTPSTPTAPRKAQRSEAREQAASVAGVAPKTISKAKKVEAEAPDLFAKMADRSLTLEEAVRETKRREAAMPKPEPAPKAAQATVTITTYDGVSITYAKPKAKPTFNPTNDHISWADWSWNPVTGCLHGCTYCYARELATKPSFAASYPVGFTPVFHPERLEAPANTKVPAGAEGTPAGRVFVCSMADLYGKWVPDEWIQEVHGVCIANPQWEYLFLTKFPSRYNKIDLPRTAWLGTSVDTQRRVEIAEHAFREIEGVRVKWLSLEPLLEPLTFTDLSMFDWVVIGSQTETRQPDGVSKAFAPEFEWVARIVAQAREAGCRVYLKPNLLGRTDPQSPGMALPQEAPLAIVDAPTIKAATR